MDPNQWNWQAYYNFLQNSQIPPTSENAQNPPFFPKFPPPPPMNFMYNFTSPSTENSQNSQTISTFPQPNNSTMFHSSNDEVETQVPQFSTQTGLENITLEDEGENSTKKKTRVMFTVEEDTHLIGTWLNVSKDPIVGVDQDAKSFWLRIKENYNMHRMSLRQRELSQLKARWHKINLGVQKFIGHYKQAVQLKKSGCSENDVMANAYVIWSQDVGSEFTLEHAWRLLKGEPKWLSQFKENCSKRTKNSASGAYSSSSNPETPVDCSEYEPTSQTVRPIGQKAAKRKSKESKGKGIGTSSNPVDLIGMENAIREQNIVNKKIAEEKETENFVLLYDILMKDTKDMSKSQLEDHKLYCAFIRRKLGKLNS